MMASSASSIPASLTPAPPAPRQRTASLTGTSGGVSQDPSSLLDSLDVFSSNRAAVAAVLGRSSFSNRNGTNGSLNASAEDPTLDPVEFLNRHYATEHMLISQLPSLREAVNERSSSLEERISTALQRQSETSESTRRHVKDAKQSILSLEKRIRLVQEKASQSERAVLEITKDMKRLDCAKRHLQKTITTLKQLHMLVHAVEQLRLASLLKPFPDYRTAAQLVDATRLLLHHFDAYNVAPMKLLGHKVKGLQQELLHGVLRGFRIVGFGLLRAMQLEEGKQHVKEKRQNNTDNVALVTGKNTEDGGKMVTSESASTGKQPETKANVDKIENGSSKLADTNKLPDYDSDHSAEEEQQEESISIMTPDIMVDGTFLVDALGITTRATFIQTLCKNHLESYGDLFCPKVPTSAKKAKQHSFKIQRTTPQEEEKPPYSLNQFDRRFAWYRRTLREICDKYPNVFPTYWNFQYLITQHFLQMTKAHLLSLLEPGQTKDKESDNAQSLLLALQKTILFEKEMMAWLQRDFGTVFTVENDKHANKNKDKDNDDEPINDESELTLEFDEEGRAVAADSAQGIRIRYERQRKERNAASTATKKNLLSTSQENLGRAPVDQVSVEPLIGCASSAFDDHMSPYIALEEQEMDERLVKALADTNTDARGEFPVFTSSTDLFVYMKTSINRCKAMTKGKAFYLLYQAFQDSLNKYAQIMKGKLPDQHALSAAAGRGLDNILGASIANAIPTSNQNSFIIPEGEEVTICFIISTCEYCADTIEALEDHISDAIDPQFRDSIDTTQQQENFHDVTAKCLKVLVSGLMTRGQTEMKKISETNWSTFELVGEESSYCNILTKQILPFAALVRGHIPQSYFRSFCDKFATAFTARFYNTLTKLKRINEMGVQQLLLDTYNLKTCLLKVPVVEATRVGSKKVGGSNSNQMSSSTSIAPAMYTKMVTKQFKRIETLLKLVGTPNSMLIEVFKSQWPGGTAMDLQLVMSIKGLKRTEQASMLEKIGLDPQSALRGATAGVKSEDIVGERMQLIKQRTTSTVGRVTNDLTQMRQKVDDFRKAFSG